MVNPDAISMGLEGWSNDFVDESLWDEAPGDHENKTATPRAENSLLSIFSQLGPEAILGLGHLSSPSRPEDLASFHPILPSPETINSSGLMRAVSIEGSAQSQRSPQTHYQSRVEKTRALIVEVLQSLTETMEAEELRSGDLDHGAPPNLVSPVESQSNLQEFLEEAGPVSSSSSRFMSDLTEHSTPAKDQPNEWSDSNPVPITPESAHQMIATSPPQVVNIHPDPLLGSLRDPRSESKF